MKKSTTALLAAICALGSLGACSKEEVFTIPEAIDGRTYSLSTDTLLLDTLPSLYLSSTYGLRIYNPSRSSTITLRSLSIQGGHRRGFQLNFDGQPGERFEQIEVLPRDSVQLFVRAFLPEGSEDAATEVKDSIRIEDATGQVHYLPVIATRQNADHVDVLRIESDALRQSLRPILVKDSVIVEQGATWTLQAPSRLWLASSAYIRVKGRLVARGRADAPVRLEAVRRDPFLPRISYSRVPSQWSGIIVAPTGQLDLSYLHLENSRWGIHYIDRDVTEVTPALTMNHCRLHNIGGVGIRAPKGVYMIKDTEVSNTLGSCLSLSSGRYEIERSSIINFYPWPGIRSGSAIVYQNAQGDEGDTSSRLYLRHCLVDGSMGVRERRVTGHTEYSGGELQIRLKKPLAGTSVHLLESSLRSIDYSKEEGVESRDLHFLSHKDLPDSLYLRMGKDDKGRKDYLFDFRPRATASFVRLGGDANGTTDLDGKPRQTPMTYGAYEVQAKAK